MKKNSTKCFMDNKIHQRVFVLSENGAQYNLCTWPVLSVDDNLVHCCYCGHELPFGTIAGPIYDYEGTHIQWAACEEHFDVLMNIIFKLTPWWAKDAYIDDLASCWRSNYVKMKGLQ